MTHHPIIDIQGLDWTYHRTEQSIFDNLHLKIEPNDFFFVVGSSGVGKTTLVKFLIRQLQPPTRMIFHNKEDIARFSATEVQAYRRNVGVIFQDFKLIDRKSVAKNISYPLEIRGVDDDEIRQRVQGVLDRLGLDDKGGSSIDELSGGEKQRVAIARALITQPEFLIADEPTGNLDRESSKNIAQIMIDLHNQGHTIVFITHDHQLIDYVRDKTHIKIIKLG